MAGQSFWSWRRKFWRRKESGGFGCFMVCIYYSIHTCATKKMKKVMGRFPAVTEALPGPIVRPCNSCENGYVCGHVKNDSVLLPLARRRDPSGRHCGAEGQGGRHRQNPGGEKGPDYH